jgi:flagellar protein FlaJ
MGYFNDIKSNLRKITSPLLASSYVSIMLFFSLVSVVFSLILALITAITGFGIGLSLVIFFIIPIVTFFSFYFYPSSKRRSLEKDINQELPFMTIYMSAIATSGIEPSKIFQIVVLSKDYPAIQREVKKLTNYINFYGYDLVSSLKLLAKNSPSEKLSQLFDGLATTITSGGELTDYLSKHSDSLLFDYRLEREKYTHVAETFMNIYISVVVAAPMILMMLFVLMSMTSLEAGSFSPSMIGLLSVLVIGLLNIGFLIFLNAKQPKF